MASESRASSSARRSRAGRSSTTSCSKAIGGFLASIRRAVKMISLSRVAPIGPQSRPIWPPTGSCRACGRSEIRISRSGPDAEVAARGDGGAAAGAGAVDRRDGRHPALFERGQHAIDPGLVAEASCGVLKARNC